jgi:hypothetical protein
MSTCSASGHQSRLVRPSSASPAAVERATPEISPVLASMIVSLSCYRADSRPPGLDAFGLGVQSINARFLIEGAINHLGCEDDGPPTQRIRKRLIDRVSPPACGRGVGSWLKPPRPVPRPVRCGSGKSNAPSAAFAPSPMAITICLCGTVVQSPAANTPGRLVAPCRRSRSRRTGATARAPVSSAIRCWAPGRSARTRLPARPALIAAGAVLVDQAVHRARRRR